MLWFDNDPKLDIQAKIIKAADFYQKKYGVHPDFVFRPSQHVNEWRITPQWDSSKTQSTNFAKPFLAGNSRQYHLAAPLAAHRMYSNNKKSSLVPASLIF